MQAVVWKAKSQSENEVEKSDFGVSVSQGCVAKTKKNVEEGDWRRTSLQASEEERRDKVGKIEMSDVRATKSNLTRLLPL